jgi:hypothetical protein
MIEDPIAVTIGGEEYLCPPMSFYCLERAWPHIQRLGRMGALNQAVQQAQLRLSAAGDDPAALIAAQQVLDAATAAVESAGADFISQTHAALDVIVASLALTKPPPTHDFLAQRLRPSEFAGIHQACTLLMDTSGLIGRAPPGESAATSLTPPLLNGTVSSPNSLRTA